MFKGVNPILIKAVTPVHAGMGRALGLIDMPIQKEKHTGIPKIEGSTMKGSMKEVYRLSGGGSIDKLFGPEDGNDYAGILGFTDAKLLFYPIITLDGIFAYVTCPYLLNRYFEDRSLVDADYTPNKFEDLIEGKCVILREKSEDENNDENIILDEYCFKKIPKPSEGYANLNLKEFKLNSEKYVVLISDDDFIEIITLCSEVITRNKINPRTGTVDKKTGSLFTEEYLPAESVLYTLALQNGIEDNGNLYDSYINKLPKFAQIGGNTTLGKGIVKIFNLNDNDNSGTSGKGGECNESTN